MNEYVDIGPEYAGVSLCGASEGLKFVPLPYTMRFRFTCYIRSRTKQNILCNTVTRYKSGTISEVLGTQ